MQKNDLLVDYLKELEQIMQQHQLWQYQAPPESAFASEQPFALDTMEPTEWLQWIFIPKMMALIEAEAELPNTIAISPYLEEALKDHPHLPMLLIPVQKIEVLLTNE
ncbi:YqcC family protein [Gallibacterium salpingitidis]|uniref:Anhydro-N-acetylmuramic acid kinase n=1 Tax=Gallibacterium salpingitidis TaxID=505341 RepID=A0A1A7NRQ8_9PAST|nr:YqcC family protein [Gallibacterium salpingitidis]OBW92902.1 anhydro-N-acetylmuramic acid kinase [Gallibacterium salpingitidis]